MNSDDRAWLKALAAYPLSMRRGGGDEAASALLARAFDDAERIRGALMDEKIRQAAREIDAEKEEAS